MTPVTPGSQRSVESGTTRFSFAGLSAAQHEMKSNYQGPLDEDEEKKNSEKATSETSEQLLAQMRE